ncbi:uncharacterized protein LOC110171992 isoform X2 [Boleophthalmus pectinirostris]|uniref:uncharacterized protein LOC110171992 isoform X2 n=1 Tax=Boleophthalmus pectinirostris TaxID=150288 RepID=UPI00242DB7B1|nr:uncharacterized protein LOC110171992 isoform X2 [Boleophthalmus pectinirostris]
MDLSKPVRYHGLVNQGATDYLNSVLQVLFMTEDFRESIKKSNAGNERIDRELKELFEDLEKYDASTYNITNKLKIRNVHEQRDAAEHFEKILRLTSPEASQIFHGKLINSNICRECKDKTETAAGFWSLPLPLVNDNNEYNVEKGIEDFFRPSVISGDDQMYCEKCDKKCDADLGCEMKDHPEVLVLLLKRFEFDYRYMTYVKNNQPVNVPQTLQISGEHLYNLYAVVEHSGELRCGHYVSIIRSQNDDEWYIFNDSMAPHFVSPTLERSRRAYLLFYRKQQKETLQDNIPNGINQTQQGSTETNQEDEGTSVKDLRKRRAPIDNEKEEDKNKKPKQEPIVGEDLGQKGQKCQDIDNDRSSSNQQMCDFNEPGLNRERGNSECTVESTEHIKVKQGPQPELKQSFASEKTDQPNQIKSSDQMYPNQETLAIALTETGKVQMKEFSLKPHFEQNEHQQGNETRENGCKGSGRCEGLSSGSYIDVNTKTAVGNNNEVRTETTEESENTGQLTQIYPKQDNLGTETIVNVEDGEGGGAEDRFKFTPGFSLGFSDQNEHTVQMQIEITLVQNQSVTETLEASENTGPLSQLYPNQDHLGTETTLNADSKGVGEVEFIRGFPLELSDRNVQTVEVMQTEITQIQKSGPIESQGCSETSENGCDDVTMTTEKQEQGSGRSETFLQMCRNTDRTIGWTSQNVYDKMQGLGAEGSPGEINNAIDENVHKIDYSTDDTKSSEFNTLSTTWQPESTAYKKLDETEMNKSWSLGESSCKNAHEREEKGSDSDLGRTGDGISHRVRAEEFSKDSEFICGSEPLQNTSYKKNDPGYSPSVNQNNLRPSFLTEQKDQAEVEGEKNDQNICFEKLEITEKSELSFEGPQKTECQIDGASIIRIIANPPSQSVSGTETECSRGGEYSERFKQERLGDDSSNVQKLENKEMTDKLKWQVMLRKVPVESCVVTIEEDTEVYRITLAKKSLQNDKTTECKNVSLTEMQKTTNNKRNQR